MINFRRTDQQSKKEFYRRMALIRKNNWASEHRVQEDEAIKFHFVSRQDSTAIPDQQKSKKIAKGQQRSQQRLRNRVAAQESRERHRSYVEELQRKVAMYEDLLGHEGVFCKNCKKSLLSETHESETILAEQMSDKDSSQEVVKSQIVEEQILNSYLDDQMIRIDNNGATSPFGIFFIVCIVAVIAVFSFNSNQYDATPRLLANYHSTVNQLINQEDTPHPTNRYRQEQPKFIEIAHQQPKKQKPGCSSKDVEAGKLVLPSLPEPEVQKMKNWTKYGKYICSEPEVVLNKTETNEKKGPQFLLLRTGRNSSKPVKKMEVSVEEKQGQSYKILSNQWQQVQISSCFLGDM